MRSGARVLIELPRCDSRITFSYPGVSSSFFTTGTSSGSELDKTRCLCLGCSFEGGDEKGDTIAGGCISLMAAVGSGLFLCGLGGLCSGLCTSCGTGGGTAGAGAGLGGREATSGLGLCEGCGGGCAGCEGGCCGCGGRRGAAAAAAVGLIALSGENRDGGRVLCGTSSGCGCGGCEGAGAEEPGMGGRW